LFHTTLNNTLNVIYSFIKDEFSFQHNVKNSVEKEKTLEKDDKEKKIKEANISLYQLIGTFSTANTSSSSPVSMPLQMRKRILEKFTNFFFSSLKNEVDTFFFFFIILECFF
jgi:hypothetical protein